MQIKVFIKVPDLSAIILQALTACFITSFVSYPLNSFYTFSVAPLSILIYAYMYTSRKSGPVYFIHFWRGVLNFWLLEPPAGQIWLDIIWSANL